MSTEQPLSAEEAYELRARAIESESLNKVLRQRSIADQTTIQRAAAEIQTLRAQLLEAQDAYDQLAQLITTSSGQTAADE